MVDPNPGPEGAHPQADPSPALVVLKFGGTSVASAPSWDAIAGIVAAHRAADRAVLLVCSAVGQTSDRLEHILTHIADATISREALAEILATHRQLASDLHLDCDAILGDLFERLEQTVHGMHFLREVSPRSRATFLAMGELMSTRLGAATLAARSTGGTWLDARQLLSADIEHGRPESARYLAATCSYTFDAPTRSLVDDAGPVAVTQGFIASDARGDTVLLGRGGSDTSAAYLAARLGADALEIWTDVPGLFSAAPRVVSEAWHLERLSYAEAEALAALGAGVLHPRCIEPVRENRIPVWVRSTPQPKLPGTRIAIGSDGPGVKAVLTRSKLALVTMRRPATWQSVGFLADVSGCFQESGLSIDMIAASPSTIQATIDLAAAPDPDTALDHLMERLGEVCAPRLERGLASLSVAGTQIHQQMYRWGLALGHIPNLDPHMVVHAADDSHVTFVLPPKVARQFASDLHALLLQRHTDAPGFGAVWKDLSGPSAQTEAR